jgi:hypothetical protein
MDRKSALVTMTTTGETLETTVIIKGTLGTVITTKGTLTKGTQETETDTMMN